VRTDKEFTKLWHDNATGMWARWLTGKYEQALEVGSFEGASAIWLLDMFPDLKITCIDTFSPGFDDITGEYEQRFDRNVAEYKSRVTKIKGKSATALKALPQHKLFDLIYIDGHHSYEAVKEDIRLAYPLLKSGGIMIFDDYNNIEFGVRKAVDEFLDTTLVNNLRLPDDYQMAFIKL
jgi:predicted O-methyltransferase YrrM